MSSGPSRELLLTSRTQMCLSPLVQLTCHFLKESWGNLLSEMSSLCKEVFLLRPTPSDSAAARARLQDASEREVSFFVVHSKL